MNSAVAAQLAPPKKNAGLFNWWTVVIQQNKRNHCSGTVAHMKNIT